MCFPLPIVICGFTIIQDVTLMQSPFSFASFLSSVEGQFYSSFSAWGVYIGLVRAAIQERISFLSKHDSLAIAVAIIAVVVIQTLIVLFSVFTLLWNVSKWGYGSLQAWMHTLQVPFLSRESR